MLNISEAIAEIETIFFSHPSSPTSSYSSSLRRALLKILGVIAKDFYSPGGSGLWGWVMVQKAPQGLWGAGGSPRRRLLTELASLDQKEDSLETPPWL